jgi:hypothetical protein
MYKKRFAKWHFQKRSYRKRHAASTVSSSPTPSSEDTECQELKSEESKQKLSGIQPGLELARPLKAEGFSGLELLLDSASSWSQSKLDANPATSDPMSRYLANPTQPLIQDSRTMYRTFELVFDLWHHGRGDLAGMAARKGFYVLEFILSEDHPDLVWHVLDTIYDMIDRGHLQLLSMFISYAHALACRRLPANHPLLRILNELRQWDYQTEQGRQYACFQLRQAWLRNVELIGQRIGSLARQHLWLYEQLIWDGRTRLRKGSQLAQRREAMNAALEQLRQLNDSKVEEHSSNQLRIEALALEFTQMDLKDKNKAEQLAISLLRDAESHQDRRAGARFHAYAHKMLARIQEERQELVEAEENLKLAVTKREAAHGTNNNLRVVRDMWVLAGHYERTGRQEDANRITSDALERAQQYLIEIPDE